MTPAEFRRALIALGFSSTHIAGSTGRYPLEERPDRAAAAEALGVSVRMISRYAAGTVAVPARVELHLAALLKAARRKRPAPGEAAEGPAGAPLPQTAPRPGKRTSGRLMAMAAERRQEIDDRHTRER
jgi:hypothetical protein